MLSPDNPRFRQWPTRQPIKSALKNELKKDALLAFIISVLFGSSALAIPSSSTGMANATLQNQDPLQDYQSFESTASARLFSNSSYFSKNSHLNTSSLDSSNFTLPDLGSGGGRFDEVNQHKVLGEWSLQQLGRSAPVFNDPWTQEQLESLAWRINAQARSQALLALMVINNPTINAFAIPGGVMGIHTGTIIESDSMDEVASVVAHEVAHISQRHYEQRGDANKKALVMQIGGMIAAIAASAASSDAATAIMMGSQTAALNSQMAFSRSNEREADRIGMQLMAKSGYDPHAMPRFFATLNQKTQLNMNKQLYLPSFIMTHPLSSERLSEAQSRANEYASFNLKQRDLLTFDLLKWRLKVLTKQATEGEIIAATPYSVGASMALAYWYGTQGRYTDSADIIRKLKQLPSPKNHADKMSFDILMAITEAQVAGMQGKWQTTEELLQPYHNLYPERRDIKLLLSDAWLQLGKYNQVITAMKPLITSRPYDIEALFRMQRAYELMAQNANVDDTNAYNTNNDNHRVNVNQTMASPTSKQQNSPLLSNIATVNALRYRGKGELWRGRYEDALISLQQAKSLVEELGQSGSSQFNSRPLIATINSEIDDVKTARDFRP